MSLLQRGLRLGVKRDGNFRERPTKKKDMFFPSKLVFEELVMISTLWYHVGICHRCLCIFACCSILLKMNYTSHGPGRNRAGLLGADLGLCFSGMFLKGFLEKALLFKTFTVLFFVVFFFLCFVGLLSFSSFLFFLICFIIIIMFLFPCCFFVFFFCFWFKKSTHRSFTSLRYMNVYD